MSFRRFAFAAALSAMATLAQAAGLKSFVVPADADGPALKVNEWSPCAKPAEAISIGPFTLPGVRDCPVSGARLPLIVVSHGFGGSSLSHHDTAETLADAGFVVVALDHPDDTASNKERAHNLMALKSRPTDIRRLIDFMLGPAPDATVIDPQRIGFFGFSRGGYTGLVLAGAEPDFRQLTSRCQDPTGATCRRIDPALLPSGVVHDPRIRAFAIADPLSSVFPTRESLRSVGAPVQLWGSERGGDGVSPVDIGRIAADLPAKPELHVVPGSGHFAFLTVCPAALVETLPEICVDGPGFDRAAFHAELDSRVRAFFLDHLPDTRRP